MLGLMAKSAKMSAWMNVPRQPSDTETREECRLTEKLCTTSRGFPRRVVIAGIADLDIGPI